MRPLLRSARALARRFTRPTVEGFDPDFYASFYPDLAQIRSPGALAAHFCTHGRAEGRAGDPSQLVRLAETRHGPLPPHFDPDEYARLNPDLAGLSRWDRALHYLQQGRSEARAFTRFDPAFYSALYFPDGRLSEDALASHYAEVGRAEGRFGSRGELLRAFGVADGAWLSRLDTDMLLAEAPGGGRLRTREQALHALLSADRDALDRVTGGAGFDASYYREAHPALEGLSDAECHAHWRTEGLADDEPGSATEHLRRLGLQLETYPEAFAWRRYAEVRPAECPNRWAALEAFLARGFAESGDAFLVGDGRERWLCELGAYFLGRDDRLAAKAYELAAAASPPDGKALEGLASAYAAMGLPLAALEARRRQLALKPHALDSRRGALEAALELGRWDEVGRLLRTAPLEIQESLAWPATLAGAVEYAFERRMARARALYAESRPHAADAELTAFVADAVEWLEAEAPQPQPRRSEDSRRVLFLVNADEASGVYWRVESKVERLRALGFSVEVFDAASADAFTTAVEAGARAAVLYRVAATPAVIRAIVAARRAGVRTVYDADAFVFDGERHPPPLAAFRGRLRPEQHAGARAGAPLFAAALQLCDEALAPTRTLASVMRPLTRMQRCAVVPSAFALEEAFSAEPSPVEDGPVLFIGAGALTFLDGDDDGVGAALLHLLQIRPQVRLVTAGYVQIDPAFDAAGERVTALPYLDREAFRRTLAACHLSIDLRAGDDAADTTSEVRWLEAARVGVPTVAAARSTLDALVDGEEIALVRRPELWLDRLQQLVDTPALRARLGAGARRKALSAFGPDALDAALLQVFGRPDATGNQALRRAV